MEKVRVGFIGAGGRAQSHYTSLSEMDDVKIVSVCDLSEARLKYVGDKFEIEKRFTDYKEMLEKVELDAVYAILQPSYMDPIVRYCLEQGENVLVEKPAGISLAQTSEWAELAEKNKCKTMECCQRRFHPLAVEAKKTLEERGPILYSVAAFHKSDSLIPPRRQWENQLKRESEGAKQAQKDVPVSSRTPSGLPPRPLPIRMTNQLLYDVVHVIDFLVWIGGDVKKVHSLSGQNYPDKEYYDPLHINYWTAIIEFKKGGIGILNSCRHAGGRSLHFEMHGKGASAYGQIHGVPGLDSCLIQRDNEAYNKAKIIKNEDLIGSNAPRTHIDGTFQLNRHFMDCIKEDKEPLINFKEAKISMRIMEAILVGGRVPPVF